MKLLNDFFKILNSSSSDQGLEIEIELNSNHIIYSGHFPGQPVTPGVIQLQIADELLKDHMERSFKLKSIVQCKFLKILNPIECPLIRIQIEYDLKDNLLKVKTQGINGNDIYFKIISTYQLN